MNDRPVSRRSSNMLTTRAGDVCWDEMGSGPTVVLLASGGHPRGDWDAVRPLLAEHFRTIAVDWPGHGDSPMPPGDWRASAAGFADVAEDVVDAVSTRPVAVIGNSVGGFAAARLAIRRPERMWALVLVDSGGFIPLTPKVRLFNAMMARPALLRAYYPRFARWYMRADNEFGRKVRTDATTTAQRPDTSHVLSQVWRSFSDPTADLREQAGAISAPTLAVWGTRDPVLPPALGRQAADTIPGATFAQIDTGHVPFATRPGEFLREVLPFLQQASESQP